MSAPALQVTYTIALPSGHTVSSPSLQPTGSFSSPLDTSSPAAHLRSLETALGAARDEMNRTLTGWKEELKVVEKEKEREGRKRVKENEEDEEEEEEE
ncbi:hypothetical protein JCM8097_000323 [Rhodosporidiobolus ruineniae]